MKILRLPCLPLVLLAFTGPPLGAQSSTLSAADRQKRLDLEKELQGLAVVDRKVMMPMRDGVRLATDIYRPKSATGPVPIVFVRTPYNFNLWHVKNGVPSDISWIHGQQNQVRPPSRQRPRRPTSCAPRSGSTSPSKRRL